VAALTDEYLELGDDENLNTITLSQARAMLDAGRGDFAGAPARVRAATRLSGDMFIAVQYPPVLAAAEAEVAAWQGRLEDASAAVADARLVAEGLIRWARGSLAGSAMAWQRGPAGPARRP
jgi:hypothetical protein